jgi:hypothetical protein
MCKLHALRHFHQEDRQDLIHLQACLRSSAVFIMEVLAQDTRIALWNCNRLIDAQRQERHRKLERKFGFRILDAVPVDSIRTAARNSRRGRFLSINTPGLRACGY